MDPVEDEHEQEHKGSFEDVKIHLIAHKIPSVILNVFRDVEYASNEDQRAGTVQSLKVAPSR